MASTFFVYMLRCRGGSLYTGITTDLERRLKEHKGKSGKGAKYTFSHEPFAFECVFETQTRQLASRLEYHIKTLSKNKKEELIKNPVKWYNDGRHKKVSAIIFYVKIKKRS